MKSIQFKKIILIQIIIILIQIIWLSMFIIPNEMLARIIWNERANHIILNTLYKASFLIPIIIPIIYLLLENKIQKKLKIKSSSLNLTIIISWIIWTSIFFLTIYTIGKDSLGYCNPKLEITKNLFNPCLLQGNEYFIVEILFFLPIMIIIFWKIIGTIYQLIKDNK